jgi:uncharacterized protein YlzI (FlbEa/FlbD family)
VKLVRFTNPAGKSVTINPDQVEEVRPADEMNPNAKTLIVLASGFQAVLEDVDEVNRKLGVT